MLEKAKYSYFITDIHNITSNLGIDLIKMITTRKHPKVQAVVELLEERVLRELTKCRFYTFRDNYLPH